MKKEEVARLKEAYPSGTRIRLIEMDAPNPVQKGTIGVVDFVDDGGKLHMAWQDGQGMILDPKEDRFEVLDMGKVVFVATGYGDISQALKKENVNFQVGVLKEQYLGEDISYHGSSLYETISVIQGREGTYTHSDLATWKHPNKIEFLCATAFPNKMYSVIDTLEDEITELEQQIQKKKQEIMNVKQNGDNVMNALKDTLFDLEQEESVEMKMQMGQS